MAGIPFIKIQFLFLCRYLLCGSGDNSAYVWRTDQPNMDPWIFSGHSGEVTSVAWSPTNGEKVARIFFLLGCIYTPWDLIILIIRITY